MTIKFSDLTLIGKLLLIPTLAVMAAAGYFGVPLIASLIKGQFPGVDLKDLGVFFVVPLAAIALGTGALFFVLSSGLLRVLGLRVFQSPTLTDPRPVREVATHLAPEEVQLGLMDTKLSDLPLIVKLLLIPTVAITAVAAYLTPLYKLYVGPGTGILFFALSASLLRVLGLIQPSLPVREFQLASRKTETGGDDSLEDEDSADGDSESTQADPTDAEAIFVHGNAPKSKSAHEASSGKPFDLDSLKRRSGFRQKLILGVSACVFLSWVVLALISFIRR